jgi:GMP synthase-like glutamine amidotransferase
MSPSVGILQCGAPPPELEAAHGSYGAMVARLLGPGAHTRMLDVTRGVLPDRPDACAAWLLTGSPAGVYDPLSWIPPLLAFLRAARGRTRLVGICFGHQAMAQAFGGQVIKSPKGWGIGLHRYAVVHRAPWMDGDDDVLAPASHQDQVVVPPADSRVTLASDFTPYAGLDYGDAISFQFHPEFDHSFARALISARRTQFGELAEPALKSLRGTDDRARVARWIDRFVQAPATTPAATSASSASAS